MSTDDTNKSVDEAILYFLSKKAVVDQTEKLALTKISSKIETSAEELSSSINRLSSKNLIRKVYLQGKVGFELTPKGKSAIDVLAKAETDRITRQLQEAIQQGRIAKLRSGTVNKMKLIDDEWQKYLVPDRELIDTIMQETKTFLVATNEIREKQPLCHLDQEKYDQKFAEYKIQVEKLAQQNSNLAKKVNSYAKIKDCLPSISADIENINKTISKYVLVDEAASQVNQLKDSLCRLKLIQSQLQSFDMDQLAKFEEFKTQLGDNFRLLDVLKRPTHEFTPTKKEALEKIALYPDPEGPIKQRRKASRYPSVEKCGKCGKERNWTPVDIG